MDLRNAQSFLCWTLATYLVWVSEGGQCYFWLARGCPATSAYQVCVVLGYIPQTSPVTVSDILGCGALLLLQHISFF